jgi:hypothetical protein
VSFMDSHSKPEQPIGVCFECKQIDKLYYFRMGRLQVYLCEWCLPIENRNE